MRSGAGVASEALQALCSLMTTQLSLRTFSARTSDENVASQRVLEKCAFVVVGMAEVRVRSGRLHRYVPAQSGEQPRARWVRPLFGYVARVPRNARREQSQVRARCDGWPRWNQPSVLPVSIHALAYVAGSKVLSEEIFVKARGIMRMIYLKASREPHVVALDETAA